MRQVLTETGLARRSAFVGSQRLRSPRSATDAPPANTRRRGNPDGRSYPFAAPPCRIYQPSPSVMQSGGRTKRAWVLAFEPKSPRWVEPLMGWTASDDPFAQVRLTFPDLASAVDYAERQGLDYQVIDPPARRNAQLGRSGGQAMPSAPHHDRLELMMMKR
jgi:hypothetical protein